MAGAARVGALHIMLGLDSAEFTAGLAKAQAGLGKFTKIAGVGMAAVGAAAVAAGAALAVAVRGAIDNADAMGETAEKVGVTVEALTSLGYVAKMSGSDTETLATALRKLSQNMLTVAQGSTGPVATAFAALGVSVKDASGALRSSDQVLLDVAEKFAAMENGATKTAMAVQIFGKSGAELVPMLNRGRAGIAELTAEADRLGITLSGSTAAAAGQFNDAMDRIGAIIEGLINKIMAGVVPGLQALANALTDSASNFGGLQLAVDAAIWVFKEFMIFIVQTKGMLDSLSMSMFQIGRAMQFMEQGNLSGMFESLADIGIVTATIWEDVGKTIAEINNGTFGAVEGGAGGGLNPLIPDEAQIRSASAALRDLAAEGKAVFDATRTPAEAFALEIENLNMLLQKGAIDQDTYNRAVGQAQDAFQKAEIAGNQLASTLASSLGSVFSSVIDGSKSAVEAVGDLLKSLGQLLINQAFKGIIGGLFGGGGGLGGFLKLPSFDGGGYTGPGAGPGLDGKGGFLAMLHPDETVVDHSKGQGFGPTVHISISGSQQDAAAIAREVRRVLPDAIGDFNRNPYRRTSPTR